MRLLAPPCLLDLSPCLSPPGCMRMKSRWLYWLSGTFLSSEWEGHPQRGQERFNLKSVQLACANVCVWEGEILTWILPHDKVIATSHQNITPLLNFCYYTSRSANNVSKSSISGHRKQTATSFLHHFNKHTHTHTLPPGPQWRHPGPWQNR